MEYLNIYFYLFNRFLTAEMKKQKCCKRNEHEKAWKENQKWNNENRINGNQT